MKLRGRNRDNKRTRRPHQRKRLRMEHLECRRVLAGVADPGFPYVDANSDELFDVADGDVLLDDGELNDGVFDTAIAEGPDYTVPIPGAGLSIYGAAVSASTVNVAADSYLRVASELTSTVSDVTVTARGDRAFIDTDMTAARNMWVSAPSSYVNVPLAPMQTLQARDKLRIFANIDIDIDEATLRTTGFNSEIELEAGEDVLLTGTTVDAKKDVDMDAGIFIIILPSVNKPAIVNAGPNIAGTIDLDAGFGIELEGSQLTAYKDILADSSIIRAPNSQLSATNNSQAKVDLNGGVQVNLENAQVDARKAITIDVSSGNLRANGATIQAAPVGTSSVVIFASGPIQASGATISAAEVIDIFASGDFSAPNATLSANTSVSGRVDVIAVGDILVEDATIVAKRDIDLDAGQSINGRRVSMTASGNSQANILLDADVFVDVAFGNLYGSKAISLLSDFDDVTVSFATLRTALVPSSSITMIAGDIVAAFGTTMLSGTSINMFGQRVDVVGANLDAGPDPFSRIHAQADGIDLDLSVLQANREIDIHAVFDLRAIGTTIRADGNSQARVDLSSLGGSIDASNFANIFANKNVTISAPLDVNLDDATIATATFGTGSISLSGDNISANAATISAAETVDAFASTDFVANLANISASSSVFGVVDLVAINRMELVGTTVEAAHVIDLEAGIIDAFASTMTAQGNANATISLDADLFVEAAFSNMHATRTIVMMADADDVSVGFASLSTHPLTGTTVNLIAFDQVVMIGATISAGSAINAFGDRIAGEFANLSATTDILSQVVLSGGVSVDIGDAVINANRRIDIDSGGTLIASETVMNAGANQGTIEIDSLGDIFLLLAELRARKTIHVEAVDSIFANGASLLAQGDLNSKVEVIAGDDLFLNSSFVRARALIDLQAADLVSLVAASIGITHPGPGDICITGTTIDVTDAVIKAPDLIKLTGTIVGIPDCIANGTLPPI